MFLTINEITMRIDPTGRVRYARCNRTNRFVKHATAQAHVPCEFISRAEAAAITSLAFLSIIVAILMCFM